MLLKQESSLKCACGQIIAFPEGEIKTKCKTRGCKAVWGITDEGYWQIISLPFAQKVAKPKSHQYSDYMEWRSSHSKKKGRSGKRC